VHVKKKKEKQKQEIKLAVSQVDSSFRKPNETVVTDDGLWLANDGPWIEVFCELKKIG
jgi:hypothetical protein